MSTKCTFKGSSAGYRSTNPEGTKLTVSCKNGYAPDNTNGKGYSEVSCNRNGDWEPNPLKCKIREATLLNYGENTNNEYNGYGYSIFWNSRT